MYTIDVLQAAHGDCLFVEYGSSRQTRRLLIDGGPLETLPALECRLREAITFGKWIDLVVLTHVDADHVEGLIRILGESPAQITPREIWFNGWTELDEHSQLSAMQGEFFGALISRRYADRHNISWGGKSVVVPDWGPLPSIVIDGGLTVTLLSPSAEKLSAMRKSWRSDLLKRGLSPGALDAAWNRLLTSRSLRPRGDHSMLAGTDPGAELVDDRFRGDDAPANGSSIAFLAEHEEGGSCLFLADAHPDALVKSLARLLAERKVDRLAVDAVKLAHHGSRFNFNRELLGMIESSRFIVSTDGSRFEHPDPEVIDNIIDHSTVRPPEILFNYHSVTTARWGDPDNQRKRDYRATYADAGSWLRVVLA